MAKGVHLRCRSLQGWAANCGRDGVVVLGWTRRERELSRLRNAQPPFIGIIVCLDGWGGGVFWLLPVSLLSGTELQSMPLSTLLDSE